MPANPVMELSPNLTLTWASDWDGIPTSIPAMANTANHFFILIPSLKGVPQMILRFAGFVQQENTARSTNFAIIASRDTE
jgi:hypothetical protein